jgi:hypothetical protein
LVLPVPSLLSPSTKEVIARAVNASLPRRVDQLAVPQSVLDRCAARSIAPPIGQLSHVNPKEIHMKKSLVSLLLALFALGSPDVFGQVPEKCKTLSGDEQKKCIDDAKK